MTPMYAETEISYNKKNIFPYGAPGRGRLKLSGEAEGIGCGKGVMGSGKGGQ